MNHPIVVIVVVVVVVVATVVVVVVLCVCVCVCVGGEKPVISNYHLINCWVYKLALYMGIIT